MHEHPPMTEAMAASIVPPAVDAAFIQDSRWVIPELETMLKTYDELPVAQQRVYSVEVFREITLNPAASKLVTSWYCINQFASHSLYRRIRAAFEYGQGNVDKAFDILSSLERDEPTAFNAVMAAWCLMRPAGREREIISYLTERANRWPDDLYVNLNLATAHFCCGDEGNANEYLARVLPQWRQCLALGQAEIDALAAELDKALAERISYRRFIMDEDSYREGLIKNHWQPYFAWMNAQPKHVYFGWLKEAYRETFLDMAERAGEPVCEIYDFGAMCGQPEYEAALARPGINFVGVDRQQTTAALNGLAFRAPNVKFLAAEIEDVLAALPDDGRVRGLFHGRTATLCYPEKIRQLYRLCARKGVRVIALFENASFSHGLYRFSRWEDLPADSVIYKNHQFIHNYPKFLSEAGYEIVKQRILFSPLVTPFSDIDLGSTHVQLVAKRRT